MTETRAVQLWTPGFERRDPSAATRTLGWTTPDLPQVVEWNADQAFRLGYAANVIAYRCVQIIANAISSVPIRVGPDPDKSTQFDTSAPLARLLGPPPGGPAPKMSARKLIRWTIAQQLVTGRRAWEIETDTGKPDGTPVAFWPLVSARLDQFASAGGNEWFRLFEYGRSDKPTRLRPDQVFYGWDPSGLDFRQPESPFQAARYDLSLVTMCDRYGLAFLRNNAVPAAVITTAAFPNEELRRRFRQQWSAEYQGADNAGRTHFNEAGEGDGPVGDAIDVKVLGLSAKDARLIEARKEAMSEVAMSLGVPWSKLDASGRTFDNAEVEDRTFWEERLLPLMQDFADDVNMQLAPRLGSGVCWFDVSAVRVLRPRKMVALVGAPSLVVGGVATVNEARDMVNLPPVEGGDSLIDPMASLMLDAPTPPAIEAANPDEGELIADVEETEEAEPRARPSETREISAEDVELRRSKIWRAADAVVRTLEVRWERAWRRLFARQEEAALARLNGKRGRQALGYGTDGRPVEGRAPAEGIDPAEIFAPGFWTDETRELSADLFEQVTVEGLSRLASIFGVAFDVDEPWVADFINARANQLAGPVTDTTYRAITTQLNEGVAVGESIPDLAKRIKAVFEEASTNRAVTIARTEVISAYNGSASLGAAQLPADVVAGQEWIATRDARTRDAHSEADGQMVAIGQPFEVMGESLAYPGDPSGSAKNIVNCRCTTAFLTPEDMVALTQAARPRIDQRAALALLALTPVGDFDPFHFRRAALEVAA